MSKRTLESLVHILLVLMMVVIATAEAGCCSNDTAGTKTSRNKIPLLWAQKIHQAQLTNLLDSIQAEAFHPVFGTFIAQGNSSAPVAAVGGSHLLGAGQPPADSDGVTSLQDLHDVAAEKQAVSRDAICKPRKLPVEVPRPSDPLVLYTPPCVMLRRCTGCCGHELLECVPTQVKYVRKKVLALRFSGGDHVSLADQASSIKRIRMKKHVKCACQCKVKSSDCSPRQRYDAPNCRCFCPNEFESSSCPGIKIWSSNDCMCKCPRVEECSTGLEFDAFQCRCLPSSLRRYQDTLLFRAGTGTPVGAAATPPRGDWGAGLSSGVMVNHPTPRGGQRSGPVGGARNPAQRHDGQRYLGRQRYDVENEQRHAVDARQRRLDEQRRYG